VLKNHKKQILKSGVRLSLLFWLWLCFWAMGTGFAAEDRIGVNNVLQITPNARLAGAGGVQLGLSGDAASALGHPAGLLSMQSRWLHASHVAYWLDDSYDFLSWAGPLDSSSAFSVSAARFASHDIPYIPAGKSLPQGSDYEVFSIYDYVVSGGFARRFKQVKVGGSLHLLGRNLDQKAFGFRGDVSAEYNYKNLTMALAVPGILFSSAVWESGDTEYQRPSVLSGLGYYIPIPYFYGALAVAWQSPDYFSGAVYAQNWDTSLEAPDTTSPISASEAEYQSIEKITLINHPASWFLRSKLAVEYLSDWGGNITLGLQQMQEWRSWSAGVGFLVRDRVAVQYAYQHHASLEPLHRISIEFRISDALKE
jgi:hypothetical protein